MIIKFCNNCEGKPYTSDLDKTTCPVCGAALQAESVDSASLFGRAMLNPADYENPLGEATFPGEKQYYDPYNEAEQNEKENEDLNVVPVTNTEMVFIDQNNGEAEQPICNNDFSKIRTIRGRISQYSSTGKEDGEYRRLFPVKLFQALVYHQRLEDVLHRFTVRVEQGEDALGYQKYTDIPVNVHGTIAGGLQLVDNAEVEVHGKYCNGILMADRVQIINNGYKSKVGFQHSVKAITYGILSAIMVAFICFVAMSSNGNFWATIKEFCTVWLIFAAILTVLYLILSLTKIGLLTRMFSNKKQSFPIFGILLISLALAFLFVSVFGSLAGFGSYLSGWVYSLVPVIIIVAALFLIIKSLF